MATTIYQTVSVQLSSLLADIESGKLALPELQRPFVWQKSAVRDLFDSLYRGFPVGYLMLWSGADTDSRSIGTDGKQLQANEFIIDGQQRLTALYSVIKGQDVVWSDFSASRIKLAFRPRDASFAVWDAAIEKDPEYLDDITLLWTEQHWTVISSFLTRLREARGDTLTAGDEGVCQEALHRLHAIRDYPFQIIRIGREAPEDIVAEVFLRVNSGGTSLKQADFILTMLSVYREEDRRLLERFALAATQLPTGAEPSPFNHLVRPEADQLLRVAALVAFKRGRLQSVLALVRGLRLDGEGALASDERDKHFDALTEAIERTLDLTSWHEYLKAINAAGFRRGTELSSKNAALLVYAIYLIGREHGLSHSDLRTTIARFFFMASLTSRYTGNFETQITRDAQIFAAAQTGKEFLDALRLEIDAAFTSDYWTITLPRELATSAARSPALFGYAAALCLLGARVPPFGESQSAGEIKASIAIRDLFDPLVQGKKAPLERHHLFPRKYLAGLGITTPRAVNQIANYSYVEWPENIEISDTPPSNYWPKVVGQFTAQDRFHHALVDGWAEMPYDEFLEARRTAMAEVVRRGFESIGAMPAVADKATPTATPDAYLHPNQPFSNDVAIRKVLRGLTGTVLWYEQHMARKALELLAEEIDVANVAELRLLSGTANVSPKVGKAFVRFREEMEAKGVGCEWRLLNHEQARGMHARVIADDHHTYELPPLNSVLAGTVDSVRSSQIPTGPFWEAYERATESVEEFRGEA